MANKKVLKNSAFISLYIESDMNEWLNEKAVENSTSKSAVIRSIVGKEIKRA